MSGLSEVEQWVQDNWTFQCGEDVNDVFEQIEQDWNPDLRFGLAQVLGNDLPDFIIWLQEQIDDECEDDTEIISFPREEIERDEQRIKAREDEEIKQLERRATSLEHEIIKLEGRKEGIIDRVKSFIRGIFRG